MNCSLIDGSGVLMMLRFAASHINLSKLTNKKPDLRIFFSYSADVDRLYSLMTKDHLFIDTHDKKVIGRVNMKQAWIGYFAMFPDYKI